MGEAIYQGISNLEIVLGLLTTSWFLGILSKKLLNVGESPEKRLWLGSGAYFVTMIFLYIIPVSVSSFTAYLLGTQAAFLVLVLAGGAGLYQGLFLSITFFSLRWQVVSVTSRISLMAFDGIALFLNGVTNGKFALSWQWNLVHIVINAALNLGMEVLGFFLLAKCLNGQFSWKGRALSRMEKLFLLTPGLFGSVCYFVIHWMILKYGLSDSFSIFQEYPYFSGMVICMNVLILLSTWVIFSLFSELERKKEEETRRAVQNTQAQELREHIRQMEQLYSGIQGMKHDMKNHIMVLNELIAKGQLKEAQAYLEPMTRTVEALDYVHKTGNPVTDVIIQEKYQRAAALGVSFCADFHFPAHTRMDVFDISVVLNNALENALEAAGKTEHGAIKVSSCWQKQMFLLEVANSFQGALEIDAQSGLPKSTKAETALHGIGLKNIRRVAESYCGAVDVEVQGHEFILTVMLQELPDKTAET